MTWLRRKVRTARERRERGDRGVAMVELAIAIPFLALLGMGIVEMGLGWTQEQRVNSAVSLAGRTASGLTDPSGYVASGDKTTLLALQSALDAESLAQLQTVYIYKATSLSNAVSPCDTGWTGGNTYNQYTGAQVRALTTAGAAPTGSPSNWATTARKVHLSDPPDYIGVCIITKHLNQTHSYWNNFTITKASVYRIEPPYGG